MLLGDMLPCTKGFISSTVAAASTMHLQSSQVGTRPHSNKALACQFKFLLVTDRAGGVARKGQSRVRDFAGYFVFAVEIASSFHCAEGRACAARLVFVYADNSLFKQLISAMGKLQLLEPWRCLHSDCLPCHSRALLLH